MPKNKLDSYKYSMGEGFNYHISIATYSFLRKFFSGISCLELGCADGIGTELLLKSFKEVVAVDGSLRMIKNLQKKVKSKKLKIIHSYFEELNINQYFDTIMVTHSLDLVNNPIKVLNTIKKFAHPKSKIIIEVPNAQSFHRQAGVLIGSLKSEYDLSTMNKMVGTQRIYDMHLLLKDINKAGLKVIKTGGFLLKPFSNKQMYQLISDKPKVLDAYIKLGEKYPDIAAEIYAICTI